MLVLLSFCPSFLFGDAVGPPLSFFCSQRCLDCSGCRGLAILPRLPVPVPVSEQSAFVGSPDPKE